MVSINSINIEKNGITFVMDVIRNNTDKKIELYRFANKKPDLLGTFENESKAFDYLLNKETN